MIEIIRGLPGVQRLLEACVSALGNGNNVFVSLARDGDLPLEELLYDQACERLPLVPTGPLRTGGEDVSPLGFLKEAILPDVSPWSPFDVAGLLRVEAFHGRFVVVRVDGRREGGRWGRFIEDFQRAVRIVDPCSRPLVAVVARGLDDEVVPRADSCLSVQRWHEALSRLDLEIFADRMSSKIGAHPLERRLRVALVTELAGPELSLARELAVWPQEELMCVGARMKGLIAEHDDDGGEDGPMRLEGKDFQSLRALLRRQDLGAIHRRIWKAQIRVLFPRVEELRIALVGKYHEAIARCIAKGKTEAQDPESLELGGFLPILRELGMSSHHSSLVRELRFIRNDLAHLQPIDGGRIREWLLGDVG